MGVEKPPANVVIVGIIDQMNLREQAHPE